MYTDRALSPVRIIAVPPNPPGTVIKPEHLMVVEQRVGVIEGALSKLPLQPDAIGVEFGPGIFSSLPPSLRTRVFVDESDLVTISQGLLGYHLFYPSTFIQSDFSSALAPFEQSFGKGRRADVVVWYRMDNYTGNSEFDFLRVSGEFLAPGGFLLLHEWNESKIGAIRERVERSPSFFYFLDSVDPVPGLHSARRFLLSHEMGEPHQTDRPRIMPIRERVRIEFSFSHFPIPDLNPLTAVYRKV